MHEFDDEGADVVVAGLAVKKFVEGLRYVAVGASRIAVQREAPLSGGGFLRVLLRIHGLIGVIRFERDEALEFSAGVEDVEAEKKWNSPEGS